jgi:hypothetical protein
MRRIGMRLIVFVMLISLGCDIKNMPDIDRQLKITVGTDPEYPEFLSVEFENSIYRAVIRVRQRKIKVNGPFDHCIRDWIIKNLNLDQVNSTIDGSAHRPLCQKAHIIYDKDDKKTIRLIYGENDFINHYTIFPNSPVIKVEYVKYDMNTKEGDWCNIVDIATPGGVEEKFTATTRLYGQVNWIRPLTYHEDVYWSIHYNPQKPFYQIVDDSSGGSLNYKGHFIMVVGNPENRVGFGRVIPIYQEGKNGGVWILKLLWDLGFEPFISTGQSFRPSFSGYIFVFDKGVEKAIEMGQRIVDGDMLIGN